MIILQNYIVMGWRQTSKKLHNLEMQIFTLY